MSAFEMVHQDRVVGKLVCFDRLIFKGHLTRFYPPGGMKAFLDRQGVLLKNFAGYAKATSDKIKAHAQAMAAAAGRQYLYLAETHTKSRGQSKEDLARQIMAEEDITSGLVCVLGGWSRAPVSTSTATRPPSAWRWSGGGGSASTSISTSCTPSWAFAT